ncbi:hypothetical protein [Streptomyces sp. NPDC055058]
MQTSIAHSASRTPWQPQFAPPLDIARRMAREVLDEVNALDLTVTDSFTLANTFGALQESLRQVLAALDAEDARDA